MILLPLLLNYEFYRCALHTALSFMLSGACNTLNWPLIFKHPCLCGIFSFCLYLSSLAMTLPLPTLLSYRCAYPAAYLTPLSPQNLVFSSIGGFTLLIAIPRIFILLFLVSVYMLCKHCTTGLQLQPVPRIVLISSFSLLLHLRFWSPCPSHLYTTALYLMPSFWPQPPTWPSIIFLATLDGSTHSEMYGLSHRSLIGLLTCRILVGSSVKSRLVFVSAAGRTGPQP